MYFSYLDWSIIACLLLFMIIAANKTRKLNQSAADFLAANRCAGRYVLAVSDGMAALGAISIVAMFEAYYKAGFTFVWWGLLMYLARIFISLSGWVQYRFRQTRALTMAQFLEIRYSKRFRVYAGILAFVSGTLNFGIFPAVGARFFKYFCGLPDCPINLGVIEFDLTYLLIMAVLLAIALYFTFVGGQIAVMVTDFIQGSFFNILMLIVVVFLLMKISWPNVVESLLQRPPGESMLNPLDSNATEKFNIWYYVVAGLGWFWSFLAWQGNQAYSASAKNAHEARMGRSLGSWREYTQILIIIAIPVLAYTAMHHPDFSSIAGVVEQKLDQISPNPDDTIRQQVTTSVALRALLPKGLLGAFAAVMLAAFISTHDTYLHSWGSIFVQDVLLPLRRKKLSPQEHMRLLRYSIIGVAIFIFFFSLLFAQYDAILMFFALTGIIFLGGGGTCIVLGLYWRKGTTAGAYCAMTTGLLMFIFGFAVQKLWPIYHKGAEFPIDSQQLWFISMVVSAILYVAVSLLQNKKPYDLDRLLNRGKFTVEEDRVEQSAVPVKGWQALFGMNNDFTMMDKITYSLITGWSLLWAVIFVVGTIAAKLFDLGDIEWSRFWRVYVWMGVILGTITTVWLTIGGLLDIKRLFARLSTLVRDETDDGEVYDRADKQMYKQK
jgi:SSS family solute:Na+ symporter